MVGFGLQITVNFLVVIYGITFVPGSGAPRELGSGLMLTHISLAMAILLNRNGLSAFESVIGAMILDFQNNALLVHLCAVESLAARWQVRIVLLTALAGLAMLGVLMKRVDSSQLQSSECGCVTIVWWGLISTCGPHRVSPSWWVYYAYRVISFLSIALWADYNTSYYDALEKGSKDPNHPKHEQMKKAWKRHTGTRLEGLLLLLDNNIIAIATFASVALTIRRNDIAQTSAIYSVGQIVALTVAVATVIRVIFVYFRQQVHRIIFFGFRSLCGPMSKIRQYFAWVKRFMSRLEPDGDDDAINLSSVVNPTANANPSGSTVQGVGRQASARNQPTEIFPSTLQPILPVLPFESGPSQKLAKLSSWSLFKRQLGGELKGEVRKEVSEYDVHSSPTGHRIRCRDRVVFWYNYYSEAMSGLGRLFRAPPNTNTSDLENGMPSTDFASTSPPKKRPVTLLVKKLSTQSSSVTGGNVREQEISEAQLDTHSSVPQQEEPVIWQNPEKGIASNEVPKEGEIAQAQSQMEIRGNCPTESGSSSSVPERVGPVITETLLPTKVAANAADEMPKPKVD
ncbi:hypothetical protein ABW20_dc0103342 [Dactylellina cionopaga]|nr:hypothetical protein ABW20_dc0103342 [Dactylellina cionopaga]